MLKLPPKKVVYQDKIELRLMSAREGDLIYKGVIESLKELHRFLSWSHFVSDLEKAKSLYAEFEAKSLRKEEVNFAGFDSQTGDFLFCGSITPGSKLNPLAFDIGYWVVSAYVGFLTWQDLCLSELNYNHALTILRLHRPAHLMPQ